MLQEAYIWTPERHDRWRKTREEGCLNYIVKMAAMATLGGVGISLICFVVALASDREYHFSTALLIPALGAISGIVTGRAFWGLSESSFEEMGSLHSDLAAEEVK